MINIICALSNNYVIGSNGIIPWTIKTDMVRFRKLTTNNIVIMGRKTYESIGKPLPNRINIVITSKVIKGLLTFQSLSKAIKYSGQFDKEIFIIGGQRLYEEGIDIADTMYLTEIKKNYEGDTYFPRFNNLNWKIVDKEEYDEYDFIIYKKI